MYITDEKLLRKNNNFDLVRLLASLLVYIGHVYGIRQLGQMEPIHQITFRHYHANIIGLFIFFTISGFLVCRSLVNSDKLKHYFLNRFLRIWPALAASILVCIFIVGVIFTSLPVEQFLTHKQTILFFIKNNSLLTSTLWLPGVYDDQVVNGYIWTIPVEVRLYLFLALLFLVAKLRLKQWLLVIFFVTWILNIIVPLYIKQMIFKPYHLPAIGLSFYFLAGACCYLYREKIPYKFLYWLVLFLAWLASLTWFPYLVKITELPFFVYSILFVAACWKKIPFVRADYSYGIYLFSYPILKSLQAVAGGSLSFVEYFIVATLCTFVVAAMSWNFIEKKALSFKFSGRRRSPAPAH